MDVNICSIHNFRTGYTYFYYKRITYFLSLIGFIFPFKIQKDNHKLSDQQQAVNEGQNPFPIYTAINVKEKYSTMDFKGNTKFKVAIPRDLWLARYRSLDTFMKQAEKINCTLVISDWKPPPGPWMQMWHSILNPKTVWSWAF